VTVKREAVSDAMARRVLNTQNSSMYVLFQDWNTTLGSGKEGLVPVVVKFAQLTWHISVPPLPVRSISAKLLARSRLDQRGVLQAAPRHLVSRSSAIGVKEIGEDSIEQRYARRTRSNAAIFRLAEADGMTDVEPWRPMRRVSRTMRHDIWVFSEVGVKKSETAFSAGSGG
jgi:hypothetical protein